MAAGSSPERVTADAPPDWTVFADVLLQRTALMARVAVDRVPSPLSGLAIADEDLDRLLLELPGLGPGDDRAVAAIAEEMDASVDAARAELDAALDADSAFASVVRSAALTRAESEVFAVVAAVELDPRRQRLVGYLNDDVTRRRLTPFTLAMVFGRDDAVAAAGPSGGLRRAALLTPPGDEPWATQAIGLMPSVAWWVAGEPVLDPSLPPGVTILDAPGDGHLELVTATGADRVRRWQAAVSAMRGTRFLVTPVPDDAEQWDAVIRQATLAESGVVIDVENDLPTYGRDRIERADHLAWGITSSVELPLTALPRRHWTMVDVAPAPATQEEWEAVFGRDTPREHELTAEQLDLVASAARATDGDVRAAVRRLAAGHIDQMAVRIRPSRGWDDIVLDRERRALLTEVVARYRHRETVFGEWGYEPSPSRGVVAMFAGPSGTGKTLSAEIIAGTLGIDLYKVDLAQLVSKYIGETEKNLSRVFDAAGASNVVLFFDEADALLGKRSDVSDAHDRYANLEVAYLLQRLERYDGLVVLATNLAKNIDPAFLRRIHVAVEFPMPEVDERREIWRRSIPKGAPTKDIDFDRLAQQFEVAGGSIRNVGLTAAFLAAEANRPISMDEVLVAMKRELQKLGRLVTPDDFGGWVSDVDPTSS